MAARVSRRSQGERRTVWLRKKEGREENAIPNVNPSDLWILVSEHGEYTLLVFPPPFPPKATALWKPAEMARTTTMSARVLGAHIFGRIVWDLGMGLSSVAFTFAFVVFHTALVT